MNKSNRNTSSKSQSKAAANPFARALAETERHAYSDNKPNQKLNPLSEAMAKTGGGFDDDQNTQQLLEEQRKDIEQKREQEQLRKKLHDQVSPVDQIDIFNAQEKIVKQEIKQLRQDLIDLAKDLSSFEVDTTLMTEVVDPGQGGEYYISFFQKLREYILLIRQRIQSARTWARQMHLKAKKRKARKRGGLDFSGNEAKSVHDTMHHERSNAYSGG